MMNVEERLTKLEGAIKTTVWTPSDRIHELGQEVRDLNAKTDRLSDRVTELDKSLSLKIDQKIGGLQIEMRWLIGVLVALGLFTHYIR